MRYLNRVTFAGLLWFNHAAILPHFLRRLNPKFKVAHYQLPVWGETIAKALGLAGGALIGSLILVAGLISFIISVMWIVFPIFVYLLLKNIHSELIRIRQLK